jgi:hypothetical protein
MNGTISYGFIFYFFDSLCYAKYKNPLGMYPTHM